MVDKNEIVRNFREAKDKPKQIRILADLNQCSIAEVQEILMNAGFSQEEVRSRKKKETPPVCTGGRVSGALVSLKEELRILSERELEIPATIAKLQLEFEKIADKRRAIETAVKALTDAFSGGYNKMIVQGV